MRKRKGVALPAAIALGSLLILVSVAVSAIILDLVTVNRIKNTVSANEIDFGEKFQYFLTHGEDVSVLNVEGAKYRWRRFVKEDDATIRSLVAYRLKEDVIKYYAIYDSDDNYKILAYQTAGDMYEPVLDVPGEPGTKATYLGGIIRLPLSIDEVS